MALSPAEKKRLDAMLREIEEDLEKAAAIDKPTTAKEALDVFGTALGQSISMNLLDEAVATYGGLTPEERAEANKSIEEARNRTLGTAAAGLAGDIVGAIPAGIGAAKLAGGKALRLLGLGAAEGAISGAGAGETPEERLLGGAIGGTIGLGAGAAGIAGGKLHRYISSQKQMTEELQRLAREQAEEQIRKEAAKASSEKLAKEAAPTRFKVKEEKVPEKPAKIIPEEDITDVNEGYQLALERFKPVTTAEKTDGPILIKAGLAPLQTPRQLPTGTKSAVDTGYTMSSEVGKGSYGTVYRVVDEKGQPKVAKVSQDPVLNDPEFKATLKHEKDLANEITALRKSANREEQKYLRHFPKFERVLENTDDPTGGYLIVMDELRPMNDYELAALFKGRSYLEDIILKLKNPYGLDPVTNVIRSKNDFILPSSHKLRRPLTAVDYENMPPNVRKFYIALEWLADEKNIKWDDLYDSNVMIDPKTGEYVAVDLGQFTLKGKEPPTARSTGALQKSLGAPGLDTRKRAEEAARKERQRFRTEEIESLPSEIPPRSLSAAAGKSVEPGSFIGITEKGPTETARATQATLALRNRAKQKKPDITDDELPEVEYLPDENTFVVRDPMLPAAESYLTLDENGILSGQWATEYTRPMRGGKKQTQKTDLFTSTDALDATMYTFGDKVKGLKSIWTDRPGLTTNTDVFQKKVHELMDAGMPQKQAELEAALETNTARKMEKYGFTEAIPGEIDYVIENGKPIYNNVEFTFTKPATQQSAIDLAREIAARKPRVAEKKQ